MEEEIWKAIQDYPNYDVSTFGNVRNNKTKNMLKLTLNSSGYLRCNLSNQYGNKTFTIHKLVALCFIDNIYNKPTVNHKDRNKINNNVNNLEWSSYSEQNIHKRKSTKLRIHSLKILRICCQTNTTLEIYDSLMMASVWVINNNLSKAKKNCHKSVMSKISAVINEKTNCNTSFGYKWKLQEDTPNENENWKQISLNLTKGNSNYFISNYGRVKTKNNVRSHFCIINGYKVVSIMGTIYYVHRLLALTYLENPENKKIVNHKDGNKLNNTLENLEWTTSSENNTHAIQNGLSKRNKKVVQYDLNMNKIREFNSIIECSKTLNIGRSSISDSCSGKYKTTKCGYIFRYTF